MIKDIKYFGEWLSELRACAPAQEWVGDRTLFEALRDVQEPRWVAWLIYYHAGRFLGEVASQAKQAVEYLDDAHREAHKMFEASRELVKIRDIPALRQEHEQRLNDIDAAFLAAIHEIVQVQEGDYRDC
jgi:hypothetical protein